MDTATAPAPAAQILDAVRARMAHHIMSGLGSLAAAAQTRDEIAQILDCDRAFAANMVRAACGDRRPELANFFAAMAI